MNLDLNQVNYGIGQGVFGDFLHVLRHALIYLQVNLLCVA